MNNEQKFTPKYWVGHNVKEDDVYINTASKSYDGAYSLMETMFGDFSYSESLKVSLMEIKPVKLGEDK